MQLSYTQLLILLTVSSFVSSEDCSCRQCSHIVNESRRCECCVYMLHGKRSGSRVLTSNIITDFNGARNDGHGDNPRAFNMDRGKKHPEDKVDESETGTVSRSVLFQILNGKLVTDYLDMHDDLGQTDYANRDLFELFLENLEALWNLERFK